MTPLLMSAGFHITHYKKGDGVVLVLVDTNFEKRGQLSIIDMDKNEAILKEALSHKIVREIR